MLRQEPIKVKLSVALLFVILSLFIISPVNDSFAANLEVFTKYPSIAVKAGEQLDTDITVDNKTKDGMTVMLDIASLPEKWEAYLEGGE